MARRRSGARAPAPATAQNTRAGRIVASYGRRVLVEDEQGQRHQCVPRGKRMRIVCGDRIRWRAAELDGDGVVEKIQTRDTVLSRPDNRGREEVLAANITQLVVVVTAQPLTDPFITDRYLAAARMMPCKALIVHNKNELPGAPSLADFLEEARTLDYAVIPTSAATGDGLPTLARALDAHTNIFVGQSGVGKSSLVNALVPNLGLATQAVSDHSGEGQHTTTAAALHHLPGGGEVIDSPGVRDYAPAAIAPAQTASGFVEIADYATGCRFSDCRHLQEPDCAVLGALESGHISARRYESYKRLRRLMERLGER